MSALPSLLLTLLLLSDVCARSAPLLPLSGGGSYDDERAEQENALSALVEDAVGSKLVGGAGLGGAPGGFSNRVDDRTPRIIIVSDSGFRGHRTHGPDRAVSRAAPPLAPPNAGELRVNVDRRETDLDMLRCMIGRVYRPCWQA